METQNFCDSNSELLNWFSKFENNKNYSDLKEKLKILSEFRLRKTIKLGRFEIPDIGPDPEILNFHKDIEDWDEISIHELKHSLKIYEGGEIESLEESIIIMEILKRQHPEKKDVLEKMIQDLKTEKFEDMNQYIELLKIDINHPNHILFSCLFFFFASLFN